MTKSNKKKRDFQLPAMGGDKITVQQLSALGCLQQYYINRIMFSATQAIAKGGKVSYYDDKVIASKVRDILNLIKPMQPIGHKKCRIGNNGDGGYVMLPPKDDEICYSFGIGDHAFWDLDMANRGLKVFQFDGTIQKSPSVHPNIVFYKQNISAVADPAANTVNIEQILYMLDHNDRSDIILQIDIEGAEWDFFDIINPKLINKFSQIIIEFHNLANFSQDRYDQHLKVLKLINATHQSIHCHFNNFSVYYVNPEFSISNTLEVSYARRSDYTFAPDYSAYPSEMDFPCDIRRNDLYIGNLEVLLVPMNSADLGHMIFNSSGF